MTTNYCIKEKKDDSKTFISYAITQNRFIYSINSLSPKLLVKNCNIYVINYSN